MDLRGREKYFAKYFDFFLVFSEDIYQIFGYFDRGELELTNWNPAMPQQKINCRENCKE